MTDNHWWLRDVGSSAGAGLASAYGYGGRGFVPWSMRREPQFSVTEREKRRNIVGGCAGVVSWITGAKPQAMSDEPKKEKDRDVCSYAELCDVLEATG